MTIAPTARPILFSVPMIRKLLAGEKTQTRRVLKVPADLDPEHAWSDPGIGAGGYLKAPTIEDAEIIKRIYPRYSIGEQLWVRETCKYDWTDRDWRYTADGQSVCTERGQHIETPTPTRWPRSVVPSIHMPKWASRLTLTISDVRVQRLLDISEADAKAEGFADGPLGDPMPERDLGDGWTISSPGGWACAAGHFQVLWAKLNPDWDGYSSPWVVAITFTVERRNIDKPACVRTSEVPA